MSGAVLSLGSNIGDKIFYLNKALECLKNTFGIKLTKISSYYETKPFGTFDSQENYVNCCVELETNFNPFVILGICLGIEASLGRKRPYRFSPRTIDIDLIMYENEVINDKDLILPHPRMKERAFVLVPMMEIFPDGTFKGVNFKEYLEKCDISEVLKIK